MLFGAFSATLSTTGELHYLLFYLTTVKKYFNNTNQFIPTIEAYDRWSIESSYDAWMQLTTVESTFADKCILSLLRMSEEKGADVLQHKFELLSCYLNKYNNLIELIF